MRQIYEIIGTVQGIEERIDYVFFAANELYLT